MKPSTKSRDKYILNFEYLFNACYAVKAASGVLTGKRFQKLKWVNDRFLLACLTVLFLCISPTTFAQVGIGTTTPDASAILDLTSTTKGVLISRVTQVQRSAIASPATGLLVFQTDNNPGYYYNAGTPGVPNWTHLFSGSSAGGWDLTGNAGTTVGTNFLGTTDAQDFAIYTNNAEKIRITSGGNVGIGTATPSIKLNTYTATGVENRFAVQSNSDFVEIYVRDTDANGTALAWSSGDNLRFGTQTTLSGTGWSEKMRMLSNGNLGIGTTSPNALLSLGTLTANSKLLIYDAGGTDTYGFGISANLLRIHSSGATTDIGFFAGAAGAEVMRVKGNGNVGIGTTAPGVKLAVWDATSPSLHLRRDATNEWYFTATPAGSDRLAFRAGGNTSANERMTILSGGNVGIGTTAPTGKLTVVENNESTTLTDFTQAVTKAGILISTEYTVGAFTPGIFWQTSNNNPTKPKAGIWLFENGSGSDMYFGTSTSYATGITNTGFVLDESGQVGIGTTSPGTRLQLFTDNTANANTQAISINRSGTNVEGAIRWFTGGASRWYLYQDNDVSENLHVYSNGISGTVQSWDYTTGNVGIGTTAPLELLHLDHPTTTAATNISLGNNSQTLANSLNNGLNVYSDNTTVRYGLKLQYTGTEFGTMMFGPNQANRFLSFGKVGTVYEDDNMIEYMRIDLDNGNVGIGTTTPGQKLDVVGNIAVSGTVDGVDVSAHAADPNAHHTPPTLGSLGGVAGSGTLNYLSKWTPDGTTLGNSQIFDNGTNIGIGTVSPLDKLHMVGVIRLPAGAGNLIRKYANSTETIVSTRRTDESQEGLFRSDGWGNFTFNKSVGIGYTLGTGQTGNLLVSNNVGIGTTAPDAKLHVNDLSGIRLSSWGGWGETFSARSQVFGSNVYVNPADVVSRQVRSINTHATYGHAYVEFWNGDIVFNAQTAASTADAIVVPQERMRIDGGTGNVGIGTTTPTQPLDVVGNIAVSGTVDGVDISVHAADANAHHTPPTLGSLGGVAGSGTLNYVPKWTPNGTTLGNSLIFDNGTNIGIGTTSPVTRVHAFGAADGFRQSFGGESMIYRYDGTNFYLLFSDTETGGWNARRPFRIQHSNGNVLLVSGTGDGNVGIGTTSPTVKLDVSGGASNTIKVSGTGGAPSWQARVLIDRTIEARGGGVWIDNSAGTENEWFAGVPYNGGAASGGYSIGYHATQPEYIANSLLRITNAGNIGIGTATPTYKLHVIGTFKSDGIVESSDVRLKKEITPLTDALAKVLALQGVTYQWKDKEELLESGVPVSHANASANAHEVELGLIAQEVEQIIPELVSTDVDGYKAVSYSKITALLIEAVKEQEQRIKVLEEQLTEIYNASNVKKDNIEEQKSVKVVAEAK